MTNETKPVLLTELEAVGAWREAFTVHRKSFDEYKAWLRERGLLAQEPVDPLVYVARQLVIQDGTTRTVNQIEAIRDGHAGKDKVNLALAALRRGMELAKPELTREMVREAWCNANSMHKSACVNEEFVDRLHAALTEGQSK